MRILVAEDNADNLDMLKRRLERKGHSVLEARNGEEAVHLAIEEKPDLVLMDVSMPTMSGLEATEAIRTAPMIAGIPIIALTAHAMESDRKACLDAGCDAFATKPVDFKALMDLIDQVCGQSVVREAI